MFLIEIERRRNGTSFSIFIIDNYPLKGVHGIFKKRMGSNVHAMLRYLRFGVQIRKSIVLKSIRRSSNLASYTIYRTEKYRV